MLSKKELQELTKGTQLIHKGGTRVKVVDIYKLNGIVEKVLVETYFTKKVKDLKASTIKSSYTLWDNL